MEELEKENGKTFKLIQQDSIPGNDKCHYNIMEVTDKIAGRFFKNKTTAEPVGIFYCCDMAARQLTFPQITDIYNYKCD